ncbi:unnamed protein product [Oikopleura dioica]|uniref:Uncharacterized protein n=1 Tax=Oikopleura dioica TaxID=34765 RepID=E4WT90_OIKDI|nr:unnamed protein product [Oikopleura dioica]
MTPESSYDISEGPFIPNRTAWPTRKIDSKVDLENTNAQENLDNVSLPKPQCQQKGVDAKGRRQSFLWTPDAVDEGMYSTYLSQKIVFTKEYPYAKAIQVLMRKDHLNISEEPKEMIKPRWRLQIIAFICCPALGMLAVLHNFRATSAFNLQNVKSQRDNMRFSRWFSVFAIILGTIAWSVLFILRKHASSQKGDLSFTEDFIFVSSNTTSSSSNVH